MSGLLSGLATRRHDPTPSLTSGEVLRAWLLRGRPILVGDHSSGEHFGVIRFLCAVAGRLDDLRLVHLADPVRPARFTAHSRRQSRVATGGDLGFLPEIEPEMVDGGRGVIVASGARGSDRARLYLDHLADRAAAASRETGCPLPLLVGEAFGRSARPGWEAAAAGSEFPGLRVFHPSGWREPDPTRLDEEWDWARQARRREPRLARQGAVAYMRDGDRLLVGLGDDIGIPGHPSRAELYEIGSDGWTVGVSFRESPDGYLRLASLVRLAHDGGLTALLGSGAKCLGLGRAGVARQNPLGPSLDPRVEAILAAHADLSLPRALNGAAYAKTSLLRMAHGHPRRADFVRTWGSLSPVLLEPGVAEAVDAGARTIPIVAQSLGVGEPIARRLAGRNEMPFRPVHPGRGGLRDTVLSRYLRALGHDALPAAGDAANWEAFVACTDLVGMALRRYHVEGAAEVAASLLVGVRARDWVERRRLVEAKGQESLVDIGDFLRMSASWVRDLTGRQPLPMAFLRVLAGGRSILRLREASLAWHADHSLHGPDIAKVEGWPALFMPADLGDGWTAVALTTPGDLHAEGGRGPDAAGMDGLDHCVGSYAKDCATGESFVVALRLSRDGRTRRVSTAELKPDRTGEWGFPAARTRLALIQHRGRANAAPPDEAERRLDLLRQRLLSGEVTLDPDAFGAERAYCGEPTPEERRIWARSVIPAYARLFPRPLQNVAPDRFVATLRTALREVAPHSAMLPPEPEASGE